MHRSDEDYPGDEWFYNSHLNSQRALVSLRNARCRGHVDGGGRCPFQARIFALFNNDGRKRVVGMCGHHANDAWLDALTAKPGTPHLVPASDVVERNYDEFGFEVWDAHHVYCDKMLSAGEFTDDIQECGDRAALLIHYPDEGITYQRCYRHCRDSWLSNLLHGEKGHTAGAARGVA